MTYRQIDNMIKGVQEIRKQEMDYQAELMRTQTVWIINHNGMLKRGHRINPKDIIQLDHDQKEVFEKQPPKNLDDIFARAEKYGPGKFAG